jgi:uncharacterized protein (DUF58 family)
MISNLGLASRDWMGAGAAEARRFVALVRRTGLNASGAAALLLAIGFWCAGRIVAGKPLYLLAYGTLVVVALAWILPRRLPMRAERRGLTQRVKEGDTLDVELRLTARRQISTVIVEERMSEALGQTVKLPMADVAKGDSSQHYELRCWRRGAFTVGPLIARYGDPVGLVSRDQVLAQPYELLVHPSLGAVQDRPETRRFEDPPMRPRISKPWPIGLEFHGMRESRPGDDIRRIVWRAVARTGRLMVREAEQGITDRIVLALNTWSGAYPAEDYSPGFETAVRVVASLGVEHVDEGYTVTVEANPRSLTPSGLRGPTQRLKLLDELARVERDATPLSTLIGRVSQRARGNAHYVIVTPRLDRAETAQLRPIVATGASVLVVVVKYGDRFEEAAHNAAALGCQVTEARVAA